MKPPDLKPLLQDDTGMCGQCCVAMIAGVSIDEAVTAVGTSLLNDNGTEAEDMRRGLGALGILTGDLVKWDVKKDFILPRYAMMTVADNKTDWSHWVVLKDGWVYDPGIGWPLPVRVYEIFIIERAYSRRYKRPRDAGKRITSFWAEYIPILGKE